MSVQYTRRSAESYKEQLKRIQNELEEIINNIEENEGDEQTEELDKEKNTYKTEGYSNSIQLKRKTEHHKTHSANIHQLDSLNNQF